MPVAEETTLRPGKPLVSARPPQTAAPPSALSPGKIPRPTGPPIPGLQSYGWHGSILDWNQRVQAVVDSYHAVHGYQPGPGLVFDAARSPVPTEQLPGLWTPGTALMNREIKAFPPGLLAPLVQADLLVTKPDGAVFEPTPLTRLLYPGLLEKFGPQPPIHEPVRFEGLPQGTQVGRGLAPDLTRPTPQTPEQRVAELERKYPTVMAGILPIDRAGDVYRWLEKFAGAGTIDVTSQQQTLSEYERGLGLAGQLAGRSGAGAAVGRARVKTLVGAQIELNQEMGTRLPTTGVFNDDWLKAISVWMRSESYYRKVVEYQAASAGFGTNVAEYTRAWKAKQGSVRHHGLFQDFLNALPLQIFRRGSDPLDVLHSALDYSVNWQGGSWNPFNGHFYTPLTHTATLALDVTGGGVQQAKAYAQAASGFYHVLLPHFQDGKFVEHGSYDEAIGLARDLLMQHPSWLKIFAPAYASEIEQHRSLDALANVVGDVLILGRPRFTGEQVAPADLIAAERSHYLRTASAFAYNYIKEGKLGRAQALLEGGTGASQLVAKAEKAVRAGTMTAEEFQTQVAQLFATGRADVGAQGAVLHSLRSTKLPTPGLPGEAWLTAKAGLRDALDEFDRGLRASGVPGTQNAADLVSWVRARFQHDVRGTRGYFDPLLAERVHDFALREFGDATLANTLQSRVVRLQAAEKVSGLQSLNRRLERLYFDKYPQMSAEARTRFEAVLGTEAPSRFTFPAGGERQLGAFGSLFEWTRALNKGLNTLAKAHARVILAIPLPGYGMSLFYKHAFADTARRAVAEDGFIIGRSAEFKKYAAEIQALADTTPSVSRAVGTFMARNVESEVRYLLNRSRSFQETFRTADHFKDGAYMTAAGGYLRRRLDDDALAAYRQSSSGAGLQPLVDVIVQNRGYRGMWKSAAARARAAGEPELSAEDYAQLVFRDFRDVENSLHAAGVVWDDALVVLRANRGAKVDGALGNFIRSGRIDMNVKSGQVEETNTWDALSGRYLERIMTFNKWNRGQLGHRMLVKTYAEMRKAGMEAGPALDVAMNLAENLTRYHMLDFANRLQIEQDLRWVSYFATKHRLYWKWVIGTLARRPGLAAAVKDAGDLLGDRGDLQFQVGGHKLSVPVARLFWVPGKEYSEISPLALGVVGAVEQGPGGFFPAATGTFGNIFTRNDTAARLGLRWIRMSVGDLPTTYGAALGGLDDKTKARVAYEINTYTSEYFAEYGHYPAEADAVKWALWHAAAGELWRSNLPLPVESAYQANPGRELLRQFMAERDPRKRRKLLDNPTLALYFGVYSDPKAYAHNQQFWARFNSALDERNTERQRIYQEARLNGWSADLRARTRAENAKFEKTLEELKVEDAKTGGGTLDSEGKVVTPGTWGAQIGTDPLASDPRGTLHALFPNVPPDEFSGVPGDMVRNLRAELKLLNDPKYVATFDTPEEAASRKREILEQIDVFQAYPSDALGRIQRDYAVKHVQPFWEQVDKRRQAAFLLPKFEKDLAYKKLREWKDEHDAPVVVDGVRFPSPLQMAWAQLDPATRKARLAQIATSGWDNLANYEKSLLGKPVAERTSEAWVAFEQAVEQLRERDGSAGRDQKLALAKQLNRQVPGFLLEYEFAQKPLAYRLQYFSLVHESAYQDEWRSLLQIAAKASAYPGYSREWRHVVDEQIRPQLSAGFRKELALYGPDFLYSLID